MKMLRLSCLIGLLLLVLNGYAGNHEVVYGDSAVVADSVQPRKISSIRQTIRDFDRLQDEYIEPQRFEFQVMLQATHEFKKYDIRYKGLSMEDM